MALTKDQWKQKLHEGKRAALAPAAAAAPPQQRMESIVGPKRMGRRQSVIERLQTRSVPPGLDGGGVSSHAIRQLLVVGRPCMRDGGVVTGRRWWGALGG